MVYEWFALISLASLLTANIYLSILNAQRFSSFMPIENDEKTSQIDTTSSVTSNESVSFTTAVPTQRMSQSITTKRPTTAHRPLPLLKGYAINDERCKQSINHEKIKIAKKQIQQPTVEDDEKIDVSCEKVRSRGYYANASDNPFSIAYIRIVYKDYHLQELLFNLMYSPTNVFCYAIDKKATKIFHQQMQNLSECFSNVHLTATEYEVDSAGHNMDRSYLECLKLIRKLTNWKYAILLQNYDIPLKTNHEMAAILRALNGSNDVSVSKPFSHRIPRYKDWSYEALHLFKDSNKNDNRILRIAKGSTAATLSRPFVEFIIDKLNLTILLKRFDSIRYGGDEMLMASLNSDDFLDAPGGYTRHCMDKHVSYITRYTVWGWSRLPCKSRRYRHGVCVFGVEDLKTLRHSHHLFANKMMPEMDYSAVSCWAKQLRSRTTHRPSAHNHTIDLNFYANLPTVQFNNNRPKWRSNLEAFNCTG